MACRGRHARSLGETPISLWGLVTESRLLVTWGLSAAAQTSPSRLRLFGGGGDGVSPRLPC